MNMRQEDQLYLKSDIFALSVGLSPTHLNDEGEVEYLGTDKEFETYEMALDKASANTPNKYL